MVGLSVVLESHQGDSGTRSSKVISKATVIINNKPSSSRKNSCFKITPPRLDLCYLCKQNLLPGRDIYMYKGDRAFCSVECRCRQIFMDEEESIMKDNCSLAAMNPETASSSSIGSSSSSSSSSTSTAGSRSRKSSRNRRGEYAY